MGKTAENLHVAGGGGRWVHEFAAGFRRGEKSAKNACYGRAGARCVCTSGPDQAMPVNGTHADYGAALPVWLRARDLLAGEDAVKAAGTRYLPRLEAQTDEEYDAYKARACFFNATRRAADAFVGLVFRKAPFVRIPEAASGGAPSGIGLAMSGFANDADMLGTSLFGYAKNIVQEVVAVGRAGTLVDWEGDFEKRAYGVAYGAEDILNWRVERVNGRNVPTLIVLRERVSPGRVGPEGDEFSTGLIEQLRVLRLVATEPDGSGVARHEYRVEVWREDGGGKQKIAGTTFRVCERPIWGTHLVARLGSERPLDGQSGSDRATPGWPQSRAPAGVAALITRL